MQTAARPRFQTPAPEAQLADRNQTTIAQDYFRSHRMASPPDEDLEQLAADLGVEMRFSAADQHVADYLKGLAWLILALGAKVTKPNG